MITDHAMRCYDVIVMSCCHRCDVMHAIYDIVVTTHHLMCVLSPLSTQQQVPEPRTESGTDLQAAKKKTEEYRKQHDAARMEIKSLREQLAQSKADVEQGGNVVALCERRIRQLEAEVSNLNAKHETRIKQLTQQFESILAQKGESSREAVARARTFGGDSNASAQLQLEASYQAQIHQKEREFRDKERDFQRRQQHYLSQISQLEDSRDKAKMRVGELREEMEADHQSQLQKLYGVGVVKKCTYNVV